MSLSMYRITVPAYVLGLKALAGYLAKASAYAHDNHLDPVELVGARLAPDMLTLAGQIQRASDTSKNAIARLLGSEAPRMEDNETTFDELASRVDRTRAFIEGADRATLDASADREVTLAFGDYRKTFTGEAYVLEFALPNFYFHVAMTHAILRNKGLPVGKLDYFGAGA